MWHGKGGAEKKPILHLALPGCCQTNSSNATWGGGVLKNLNYSLAIKADLTHLEIRKERDDEICSHTDTQTASCLQIPNVYVGKCVCVCVSCVLLKSHPLLSPPPCPCTVADRCCYGDRERPGSRKSLFSFLFLAPNPLPLIFQLFGLLPPPLAKGKLWPKRGGVREGWVGWMCILAFLIVCACVRVCAQS